MCLRQEEGDHIAGEVGDVDFTSPSTETGAVCGVLGSRFCTLGSISGGWNAIGMMLEWEKEVETDRKRMG